MKAFLLVCLIATSMLVNARSTHEEAEYIPESDSPSFLHLQQSCSQQGGTCCTNQGVQVCCSQGQCGRGFCSNILAHTCVQG